MSDLGLYLTIKFLNYNYGLRNNFKLYFTGRFIVQKNYFLFSELLDYFTLSEEHSLLNSFSVS